MNCNSRANIPAPLIGRIEVPGDKSIVHRGILFSGLANGRTLVRTSVVGRDNLASLRVLSQIGVAYKAALPADILPFAKEEGLIASQLPLGQSSLIELYGQGLQSLSKPADILYCGNSGTTARLILGILAACPFEATIDGDRSLRSRPFARVVEPLSQMGAEFSGDRLPIKVKGGVLRGIDYSSQRASAQVKSAIMLAGVCSGQEVKISEPHQSRDHSERMLAAMGCDLTQGKTNDGRWQISMPKSHTPKTLSALEINVPGDFSSAAFFLVAGTLVPGSEVSLQNVGFNPTRRGLFEVLKRMGASIDVTPRDTASGEEVADLVVRSAELRGVDLDSKDVLLALDEIPILAVAAAFAKGITRIRGASELRVKESDRLSMIASFLREWGFVVDEFPDGLDIHGRPELLSQMGDPSISCNAPTSKNATMSADWANSHDHRILMSACILKYVLSAQIQLLHEDVVETSFPGFSSLLTTLARC